MRPSESLLPSTEEFLEESLRNLRDERLSLAILHAVTATELMLKERLRRLNPALILENIDARRASNARTLSLAVIPHRLANLGHALSSPDQQLVTDIAKWRHEIVHHLPSYDEDLARKQLPNLLNFLANQMRTELGVPLEDFLPVALYRDAHRYIADWQTAVKAARLEAHITGKVVPASVCPKCAGVEVISQTSDDRAHCHLCRSEFYVYDHCSGCGSRVATSFVLMPDGVYCDECLDDVLAAHGEETWEMETGR